jgi:mRNA-degrading endonuclease RelE of RelBE toxin-antitoxin system
VSAPASRYRVEFSASGRRDLNRLPERVLRAVLEFVDGPLAENPYRVGKPLVGQYDGAYSARRGSFRIVYEIHDDEVLVEVIRVAHRAEAYRRR